MPQKKYRKSKKTEQIPLNAIRVKKSSLTLREIKKLKLQLHRNKFKILKVEIKPVDRRDVAAKG